MIPFIKKQIAEVEKEEERIRKQQEKEKKEIEKEKRKFYIRITKDIAYQINDYLFENNMKKKPKFYDMMNKPSLDAESMICIDHQFHMGLRKIMVMDIEIEEEILKKRFMKSYLKDLNTIESMDYKIPEGKKQLLTPCKKILNKIDIGRFSYTQVNTNSEKYIYSFTFNCGKN